MATNLGKPLRLRNDGGAQLQLERSSSLTSLETTAGGDLALTTNAVERLRITSAGNVGIGVTTPSERLSLVSEDIFQFSFKNSLASSVGALGYDSTDNMRFFVNGAERLRITAAGNLLPGSNNAHDLGASGTAFRDGFFARDVAVGRGVAFPATHSPSTDPNTLDDYEEGTFTPTFTSGFSSGPTSYPNQVGSYTKIGRFVHFQIDIRGLGAIANATGIMISGLPFSIGSVAALGYGGAALSFQGGFNTNAGDSYHPGGSTIGPFTNTGSPRLGNAAGVDINGRLILYGSYQV